MRFFITFGIVVGSRPIDIRARNKEKCHVEVKLDAADTVFKNVRRKSMVPNPAGKNNNEAQYIYKDKEQVSVSPYCIPLTSDGLLHCWQILILCAVDILSELFMAIKRLRSEQTRFMH